LAPSDRWVARFTERYGDKLAEDKGGPDEITAGMKHAIEIAQTARACGMLILAEARRRGFIAKQDGTWDLAPGAKELAKFMKLELGALQALGFDKREPKAISLEDITADYSTDPENSPLFFNPDATVSVATAKVRRRRPRRTIRATTNPEED
jgi:hypothetical protein